jgi:hypothetical protein
MGNVVNTIEPVRQARFAEAWMRRRDEAAFFGQRRHERLLRTETSATVEEQNGTRRPLAGIEQFKLDVCDSHLCRLHAIASRGEARCKPMTAVIAFCVKRCTSTLR